VPAVCVEPPGAGEILAIAAHPDDIESWCAGTLARTVDRGATVRLLLVTSGDKGASDPDVSASDVARVREAEAVEAARRLGLSEVAFLRHPDGDVEDTRAVFTHDPEHPYPAYLTHRDHRVVGRAVLDAIYPLARDRLSFPEHAQAGLTPHAVGEVWLFSSTCLDTYVDISASFERKVTARLAHGSQTSDPEALRRGWRERAARIGAEAGLPLAEAFVVLPLD